MPPRTELDHPTYDTTDPSVQTTTPPSSKHNNSSNLSTTSKLREKRRPRIAFKNTHALSGVASALLTCAAIAAHHVNVQSNATSILAAIASIATASSGMNIVDKAPKQTIVMERPFKVIPPHREAFRRTGYSIYYLCARIAWNIVVGTTNANNYWNWIWGILALSYAIAKFVPRDVDWSNGNTWVFVLPMALGLTVDALFQLPLCQCNNSYSCWNEEVITQSDLLWVLLSGLAVAFAFTLAFRGVVRIKDCYWGAAVVVHGIVVYLIAKAVPFVTMLVL